MKLFLIETVNLPEAARVVLQGPDSLAQQEFIEIVDSLIESAALSAYKKYSGQQTDIGWSEIILELPLLLESKGFTAGEITVARYPGPFLISAENEEIWNTRGERRSLLGQAKNLVEKHNDALPSM